MFLGNQKNMLPMTKVQSFIFVNYIAYESKIIYFSRGQFNILVKTMQIKQQSCWKSVKNDFYEYVG